MRTVANSEDMLTIDEVEREFALKRSTLYRYVRLGSVTSYRRACDQRSYFKRTEIESIVQFQPRKTAVRRRKTFNAEDGSVGSKKEALP